MGWPGRRRDVGTKIDRFSVLGSPSTLRIERARLFETYAQNREAFIVEIIAIDNMLFMLLHNNRQVAVFDDVASHSPKKKNFIPTCVQICRSRRHSR